MNDLQIQYFLKVAELNSYTEAARHFYVSQPAISKQIRLLEKELGFSLFGRAGRKFELTDAGQAFYNYFLRCHFQMERIKDQLKQSEESGTVPVRIGYLEGLSPSFFLPVMETAAAANTTPVGLSIAGYSLPQLIESLHTGRSDAILAFGSPLGKEDFLATPIAEVPRVLLYSFSRFPHGVSDISQLKKEPFFLPEDEYTLSLEQTIYEIFLEIGFTPHVEYAPNYITIIDRVERGEGVFIYNEWCRQKAFPGLGSLPLSSTQTLYLFRRKSGYSIAGQEFFNRLLSEEFTAKNFFDKS